MVAVFDPAIAIELDVEFEDDRSTSIAIVPAAVLEFVCIELEVLMFDTYMFEAVHVHLQLHIFANVNTYICAHIYAYVPDVAAECETLNCCHVIQIRKFSFTRLRSDLDCLLVSVWDALAFASFEYSLGAPVDCWTDAVCACAADCPDRV
jgi:hypothetical protein